MKFKMDFPDRPEIAMMLRTGYPRPLRVSLYEQGEEDYGDFRKRDFSNEQHSDDNR